MYIITPLKKQKFISLSGVLWDAEKGKLKFKLLCQQDGVRPVLKQTLNLKYTQTTTTLKIHLKSLKCKSACSC